jgi:putative salt-induced outer membrane protein
MRGILVGLSMSVFAAAWPGLAAADWTGKGELGAAFASGNTDNENVNAKLELANELEKWKHSFGLSGQYASDSSSTTGQRWELYGQSDYKINARDFWFGAARYEDDRFSGFDYQATISTGLGRKFIDTERTKLVGSAGVGFKYFETRDVLDDAGQIIARGDTGSGLIFRGTVDFEHGLTDNTRVIDKFLVESGADNTFLQNDLALQVKMTEVLALSVGYSVRHNTDPPTGYEKTDTLTTVNLVYEFK